jgi:hypothetical protein
MIGQRLLHYEILDKTQRGRHNPFPPLGRLCTSNVPGRRASSSFGLLRNPSI